jgi:hypothetical protein
MLVTEYPNGTALGSETTTTGHGLSAKIPGIPADAGGSFRFDRLHEHRPLRSGREDICGEIVRLHLCCGAQIGRVEVDRGIDVVDDSGGWEVVAPVDEREALASVARC